HGPSRVFDSCAPLARARGICHDGASHSTNHSTPRPTEKVTTMSAFPAVQKIRFEGPKSKNPLSFRHYDENEVVEGKSMKDHFRFAVAYWHTFRGTGFGPVGPRHQVSS